MLSVYLGYSTILQIKEYSRTYLERKVDSDPQKGLRLISLDEFNNRKVQVKILMVGNIVSSSLLFLWDYFTYQSVDTEEDCESYCEATGFFTTFFILALKVLSWVLPVWTIYFIFYWRNRTYFSTIGDNERDMNVFDELRSELINE
jgi:hypothetical protein